MKNHAILTLLAVLFLAAPARSAGPQDGVGTAQNAASARLTGAILVEVEGFADPKGDIPCARNSFSFAWHYKFYSPASREWLLVNACGSRLVNTSRHFPSMNVAEPTPRVPFDFADSAAVLEKLAKAGAFKGTGSAKEREILMNMRIQPAKKGAAPACHWTVSQGRAKAVIDCAGEKIITAPAQPAAPAGKGAGGAVIKGKDTAGRDIAQALSAVGRKYPRLALLNIETLADKTGSAKCIVAAEGDGWSFNFYGPGKPDTVTYSACKGKTLLQEMNFAGKPVNITRLSPIPGSFKNSDEAMTKIPKSCLASHSTFTMRLNNFAAAKTPVTGHNLLWTVECGTLRYYVDAATGRFLGGGEK